uniref:TLC domain-containing protein n=1 Tax=Polyblepharides amylifera TaxID=1486889 RepID=A0A7R9SVG7_9CHLO|mmetsp:Transcript_467/g.654  ORF Transcript_467/g.654 Transcript_467/m.654 type:complete len:207 (+) Transcript_467:167-787(+)
MPTYIVTAAGPENVNWKRVKMHDKFNLFVLPVITVLAVLGNLGVVSTVLVANTMSAYMALDFVWIYIYPSAIISKAKLILTHHIVVLFMTLSCVSINPEYAYNASWSLLVELNTACLVLSRFPQFKNNYKGKLLLVFFWITAILFRVILPPWLLWHFIVVAPQMHPTARLSLVACQSLLCCFNMYFVYQRMFRDRIPASKEGTKSS